jgi:phosphatidylglycerophosphate synthase
MSRWARADAIRWGALTVGILLFAAALYYINIETALDTISRLGIALPLALLISGLWHLARTWAWAWCFPEPREVGFWRLVRVRLAAEAFSYLTLRGIAGEPLKVVLLNDRLDPRASTAAVALERIAYLVGTTLIVGVGSVIAIVVLPLSRIWFRVFRAFAIAAGVVFVLAALVVSGRGTYLQALLKRIDGALGTAISGGRVSRFVGAVERQMLELVRSHPRRLLVLLSATLLSYALMALEAWVLLQASGTPVSAVGALTVETFSRVASFASAFIPANLGALEASSLAAVSAIGIAGGGAALALGRRIRGLFWAGVGLAIYPRTSRRPDPQSLPEKPSSGPTLLYVLRDPDVQLSPHLRLAGMPLSERILHAAFKAGYARVIVWTGVSPAGREPRSFTRLVRQLGSRVLLAHTKEEWRAAVDAPDTQSRVAVVGPGTLVSPALLREAAEGTDAAGAIDVPAGDGWPVSGLLRLDRGEAGDLTRVAGLLRDRRAVTSRPSGDDVSCGRARLAIRMVAEDDVPGAEFTLRRSSYKDTDAKVARFNRTISVPISVALIRTPLTANQLSVSLVALGFYSAWLFSIGEYLPGVLGGFLSLAASVLDGCDGEIARLKYQESALGCWIETFGDYSYYVAIFIGLTVGAVRQTGWEGFYWVGLTAMAGTLVTFALLIYLRARITNGNPNRLHAIAKQRFKAEPSLWSKVIWRVSFVATRAAMPYGIMALALLNLLPLVIVLAAIGGNVYWISLVLKLRDLIGDRRLATADVSAD